jgi:hypothetical protein
MEMWGPWIIVGVVVVGIMVAALGIGNDRIQRGRKIKCPRCGTLGEGC